MAALHESLAHFTSRREEPDYTAIKEYSYMDRARLQEVDIHDGLENTLIILGHKLNDHGPPLWKA